MEEPNTQNPSVPQPEQPTPPVPVAEHTKKKLPFVPVVLLLTAILLASFGIAYYISGKTVPVREQADDPQEVTTQEELFLALDSTESTTVDGELLVRGRTLPDTTVVVYTNEDEESLESDATGAFETTVLVSEEDSVTVTAYSEDGEEQSQTFAVSPSL